MEDAINFSICVCSCCGVKGKRDRGLKEKKEIAKQWLLLLLLRFFSLFPFGQSKHYALSMSSNIRSFTFLAGFPMTLFQRLGELLLVYSHSYEFEAPMHSSEFLQNSRVPEIHLLCSGSSFSHGFF